MYQLQPIAAAGISDAQYQNGARERLDRPPSRQEPETPAQRAERIFNQLDVDESGFVDRDELFQHVMSNAGVGPAVAERIFQEMDFNADGRIELSEWLRTYASKSTPAAAVAADS